MRDGNGDGDGDAAAAVPAGGGALSKTWATLSMPSVSVNFECGHHRW